MSGTVQKNSSLQVTSGNLQFRSNPTAYNYPINTVNPANGNVPGGVSVPLAGCSVNFFPLVMPGRVWMQNLDPTNVVEWGVYDVTSGTYTPIGVLLPGLFDDFNLSPNFGKQDSPGTGTHSDAHTQKLYFHAYTPDYSTKSTALINVLGFES